MIYMWSTLSFLFLQYTTLRALIFANPKKKKKKKKKKNYLVSISFHEWMLLEVFTSSLFRKQPKELKKKAVKKSQLC